MYLSLQHAHVTFPPPTHCVRKQPVKISTDCLISLIHPRPVSSVIRAAEIRLNYPLFSVSLKQLGEMTAAH